MNTHDQLQRTPEWDEARLGRITASKVRDVSAKTKTGSYTAARDTYKWNLVTERITGVPTAFRVTTAMQWGIDNEEDAKAFYGALHDIEIVESGFVLHPEFDFAGASPDGLIGDNGLIEVKCMETVNHLRAIAKCAAPEYYVDQCHWQMACTDREWCDLTIYDPRVPEELQMRRFRIHRDDSRIDELEHEVSMFNDEIENIIANLRSAA